MAVTAKPYPSFVKAMANKEIDLDTDTIKVALLSSSYAPNQAHDYYDDVSAAEVGGVGYTAGGATLGSKTVAVTGDAWAFDAADIDWDATGGALGPARYAVLYDDSPSTAATKPLIGLIDFGADVTATNGHFTITWAAAGIITSDAGW